MIDYPTANGQSISHRGKVLKEAQWLRKVSSMAVDDGSLYDLVQSDADMSGCICEPIATSCVWWHPRPL